MSDLFREVLTRMGLRDSQVHELRDRVRRGDVQLVFLLDAYDELSPSMIGHNLYRGNNLEQFRCQDPANHGSADAISWPKVIITSRSELFADQAKYPDWFFPVEATVAAKDTAEEAKNYFDEMRLAPFGPLLDEYIRSLVALQLRQASQQLLGVALAPLTVDAEQVLDECIKQEQKLGTPLFEALVSMKLVMTAPAGPLPRSDAAGSDAVPAAGLPADADSSAAVSPEVAALKRVLPLCLPPDGRAAGLDVDQVALRALSEAKARGGCGSHEAYRAAYDSVPELSALVTTPFMVEIVLRILSQLEQGAALTDSDIKTELIMNLGDGPAEAAWALLCAKRTASGLEPSAWLKRVQRALERDASVDEDAVALAAAEETMRMLQALAVQITERSRSDAAALKLPQRDEVERVLRFVLRRRPVRRSRIYRLFVEDHLMHEARKCAASGVGVSSASLLLEASEYAQRLALCMVQEGVSKVVVRTKASLFKGNERGVWDAFTRQDDTLLNAARRAAPVRFEGSPAVLTFIHKVGG
jgi:hypothetical protein